MTSRAAGYIVAPAPAMQAIRYMYSFLTREVDRLADIGYAAEYHECLTSNVEPPPARAWKSAFRVGAASVIQDRLSSQRQTTLRDPGAEGSPGPVHQGRQAPKRREHERRTVVVKRLRRGESRRGERQPGREPRAGSGDEQGVAAMTEEQKQEIQARAAIIHDSQHDPLGHPRESCLLYQLIHTAVSAGWHLGWADREITEGKAVVERDEIITEARKALEAAKIGLDGCATNAEINRADDLIRDALTEIQKVQR